MTQVSDIDLLDGDFAACPHPAYAALRSEAPVCRVTLPDGRDGWLVTQYESVRQVLQDHDRFSNRSNRDEQRFDAPDTLDISRTNNRHLAFGRGIHTCPGAPLARMEATIAIETLLRRMPDLSLAVAAEQLQWRPGGLHLRGLAALPLTF